MTDVIDSPEAVIDPPYRVIGARVDRYDAAVEVTGRAQYGADISPAQHALRQNPPQPARLRPHPLD
ncbi:MAG: hypothetical protein U0521_04340 [Anaerolineae bacterium]